MVIVYIILIAFINVAFYIRINKTHLLQKKTFSYFLIGLAIICVLHTGLFQISGFIPTKVFFNLFAISLVPIIFYLWFYKLVVKRVSRLNGPGEKVKVIHLKIVSVMTTILPLAFITFIQIVSIISYMHSLTPNI